MSPRVSILIPCYRSRATLRECLDSLAAQAFTDFELLLIDSTPEGDQVTKLASEYPFAHAFYSSRRLLPHEARNFGFGHARGSILVFTDPDMRASRDWLAGLVAAHDRGESVVGGGVDCPPDWWCLGVHFLKYGPWMPIGASRAVGDLPSGNLSVSRDAFVEVGCFPANNWAGDLELCWRLREAGHQIWFEPNATVCHLDRPSARNFLHERFERGRDFGTVRIRSKNLDSQGRLLFLLRAPLLPWVVTCEYGARAIRAGIGWMWLSTIPVQIAGFKAWFLGEAISMVRPRA